MSPRGGKREGAGRPIKDDEKRISFTCMIKPFTKQVIEKEVIKGSEWEGRKISQGEILDGIVEHYSDWVSGALNDE